ncbi:MAG: sigma-54 dependent transcriptional regulator [Myxococcota bacterium]
MQMVGSSPTMRELRALLPRVAAARRSTLIAGPTGSGKEVVARQLHELAQPGAPYVAVHCGALPELLIESELFGHSRGAFTGASEARAGLIRTASRGTLFLDEIDSLSPAMQARLLRFLETGEIRAVGSDRTELAQAWVLAATNHDLGRAVAEGRFRADLLYRLEVMRVTLPPLAQRGDDVLELADHFLAAATDGRATFSDCARAALRAHGWPGNVRELRHCIDRAVALGAGPVVIARDLGLHLPEPQVPLPDAPTFTRSLAALVEREGLTLGEAMERCEQALIAAALELEHGNRTRAAQRLGIHVRTIFKKMA